MYQCGVLNCTIVQPAGFEPLDMVLLHPAGADRVDVELDVHAAPRRLLERRR